MSRGKCIHCNSGVVLHDDGMHRSLGWEVPCQRSLTAEEERLMWRSLRASTEHLYDPIQQITSEEK